MTFERAWILWLAIPLLAMLLLAAVLRARRRRVVVPSLIPWNGIKERVRTGTRARRLPSLLVLQAMFVLFALLAAAGPALVSGGSGLSSLTIILDRTAGMKAPGSGASSRMEDAKAAVREELSKLPTSAEATLRCVPPLDSGDLRLAPGDMTAAIDRVEATDVPGSIWRAVAACAGADSAVLAVTDDVRGMPRQARGLTVVCVGSSEPNLGISWISAVAGENGVAVPFVRVCNASSSAVEFSIDTLADGNEISRRPARLDPFSESGFTLDPVPDSEQTRSIEVRVLGNDRFAADDRAFLARGSRARTSIALSGAESPDLVRALEAAGDTEVSVAPPDEGPGGYDLVVWLGRPPSQPLHAPALVVDPPSGFLGLVVESGSARPHLTLSRWLAGECPGLAGVQFSSCSSVPDPPAGSEIAVSAGGKAVVFLSSSSGFPYWFVGLPVERGRSEWRRTPWFPIFWKALVSRLAGSSGTGNFSWSPAGSAVEIPGSPGSIPRVLGPDGASVRILPEARKHVFVPTRAGIYEVSGTDAGPSRRVAVNICDREESDLRGTAGVHGGYVGEDASVAGRACWPTNLAAVLAAASLLALLAADLRARGRRAAGAAALAFLLAAFAAGCGRSGKESSDPAEQLRPGRPLPTQAVDAGPAASKTCPSCGRQASADHVCGKSAFCPHCKMEASLGQDHVCGMSKFCPVCGREAALSGHRCGRTRFCGKCNSEVPIAHKH